MSPQNRVVQYYLSTPFPFLLVFFLFYDDVLPFLWGSGVHPRGGRFHLKYSRYVGIRRPRDELGLWTSPENLKKMYSQINVCFFCLFSTFWIHGKAKKPCAAATGSTGGGSAWNPRALFKLLVFLKGLLVYGSPMLVYTPHQYIPSCGTVRIVALS